MSMLHFVQQQLKGSSCYAHALAACLSSLPCQQVAPPSAGKLGRTSEEVNCTAAGGASNTSCHCLPRTQASHSWSARSQSCSFSTCCRASVPDSCREPCQGTSPTFRTGMPAHIISFPSIHQARDLSTSQACQTSQAAEAAASRQEPESGPARIYWDKRHAGVYRADPRQELTINMLQDLFERLVQGVGQPRRLRGKRSGLTIVDAVASKDEGSFSGGGFWSGINSLMKGSRDSSSDRPHIQGLYMYGGVGCGKTMLMDLFVEAAPPELQVKRTHFHDFMLEVHTKLRDFKCDRDPLLRVADSIAKNVRVLAMDEFFVTDVADAMILHRLFGRLWDREVVLVATSNRPPDKLYEGGLQRSLFMPFIDRLKDECQEHNMESKVDYRRLAHSQRGLYFSPLSWDKNLREEFGRIAEDNGAEAAPETVQVAMGRHLDVALSAGKACMFTFDDLCGKPVAAADYIALTEHYQTLALSGVPKFNTSNVPQAYRFVTLIDVLYEHRVRVLISAEAFPFDLFDNVVTQAQAATNPSLKERQDTVVDDNLGFAKDRTISRLTEMQSLEYLLVHAQRHSPESMLALQEANRKNKFWLSFHRKEQ